MSDAKYTPGPWVNCGKFGDYPNESFHVEIRSDTTTGHVATVDVLNNTRQARERADANANLISAAPDMLAVLREINEFFHHGTPAYPSASIGDRTFKEMVEAAITKAKGTAS